MAGFSEFLKGAQGMVANPMFAAGASIYSGGSPGQAFGQMQQSQMQAGQQRQQAEQKAAWQKFSQSGQGIPQHLRQLLPFMSPGQGASAIASSQPKAVERPWWAGPNGQVDPAMLAKTAAGRAQSNVTVSPGFEKSYDKELGKEHAKYFVEGQKGALTANRDLNNLRVMESALKDPNLYTGTAANTVQGLKKAASTLFGVPVQGVGSGEVVQNLSKEIALGLKDNLPGPLSDSDRRFLVDIAPGLQNSPEGNKRIVGLGMLQKRYQIARAQAARDYAKANGGRIDSGFYNKLEAVENDYAQKFSGMINSMRDGPQQETRSPLSGIPQLQSLEQYRSAPSGTQFVAPDGTVRVKP